MYCAARRTEVYRNVSHTGTSAESREVDKVTANRVFFAPLADEDPLSGIRLVAAGRQQEESCMARARIIALSGEVATGKTEVTSHLARLLPDWEQLHVGDLFREYAAARGMSVIKVSHLPNEVHREFDERARELIRQANNLIVEGRMSGVLAQGIEGVLTVFLYAPMETRARRYLGREGVKTEADAQHEIQYRDVRDRSKLRQVYQLQDYRGRENYHLMINSGLFSPEQIAALIVAAVERGFATPSGPPTVEPSSG